MTASSRVAPPRATLERHGLVRIHTSWAVNPGRVREIRPQRDGRDWEVVMDPPVNRILPVARGRLATLLEAYGERGEDPGRP